jgi:Tfp pilus assembly protein PilO
MDLNIKKNIELKYRVALSAGLFIISFALILFLVIIPSVSEIERIKKEIYDQKIDLEIKYKKGQDLRKVTEKLNLIKEKIFLLDQVFIKKDDNLRFITGLEDIAEKNNINQKINMDKPDFSSKKYQEASLSILAQGNLSDQLNYLGELENLSNYINIHNIVLSSTGGSTSMNISSKVYWLE